jgi:hypothetical protein
MTGILMFNNDYVKDLCHELPMQASSTFPNFNFAKWINTIVEERKPSLKFRKQFLLQGAKLGEFKF